MRRLRVELAGVFVVELLDDPADTLLGDVGDGGVVLAAGGFGELDEDELAVAAVLLVQVEDGLGGCAGTGEEVENDVAASSIARLQAFLKKSTGFGVSKRLSRKRSLSSCFALSVMFGQSNSISGLIASVAHHLLRESS